MEATNVIANGADHNRSLQPNDNKNMQTIFLFHHVQSKSLRDLFNLGPFGSIKQII
jgi:hypothetical protein